MTPPQEKIKRNQGDPKRKSRSIETDQQKRNEQINEHQRKEHNRDEKERNDRGQNRK